MRPLYQNFVLLLFLASWNGANAQYKVYGTTTAGGDSSAGVIFSIYSDGSHFKRLYSFKGGTDGNGPDGPLTMGPDSKLYGLTAAGGASGGGIIFAYDTATHVYRKLADLTTSTGFQGEGGLVWFKHKLYGLGIFGGANGNGTILSYDPATDSLSNVYDLTTANGAAPFGSMTVLDSLLYFTTNTGGTNNGGVLNVYNPATGTVTALYNFPNGSGPWSSLRVMNKILYGVEAYGGPNHLGEIYSYNPGGGGFTAIFDYDIFDDGVYPYGVVPFDSLLYGSTANGGKNQTGGTLNYTNPETDGHSQFYSFDYNNNRTDGGFPYGPPIITPGGIMLGMTERGGSKDSGIIYSYDLHTSTFTKLLDFKGPNGSEPIMNTLYLPVGPSVTAPPPRILQFTGVSTEEGRVLNWTVSQPAPGCSFQLQRSTDEVSFLPIDSVPASDTASTASYSHTDGAALPGVKVVYYRLKMTDTNQVVLNSNILAIGLDWDGGDSLRLINTVVSGIAYLQYTSAGSSSALNLRIVSMSGQLMIRQLLPVSSGINSYSIDASALPRGIYVLQVGGRSIRFVKL
jgi:uncharacterized repeat protein (TIGR03803 family)